MPQEAGNTLSPRESAAILRDKFGMSGSEARKYITDGLKQRDHETSLLQAPKEESIPVSGVMGMFETDTPENIQYKAEAAHTITRHGLPVAAQLAGAFLGSAAGPGGAALGEMLGGMGGEMIAAPLHGEMPDLRRVLMSGAVPGIARGAIAMPRAVVSFAAKWLPGFGIATHKAAIEALTSISAKFEPTKAAIKQAWSNPLFDTVKVNVTGLADDALKVLEKEMKHVPKLRNQPSIEAAHGILETLGHQLPHVDELISGVAPANILAKLGTGAGDAAAATADLFEAMMKTTGQSMSKGTQTTMSISALDDMIGRVYNMRKVLGANKDTIGRLYRKGMDAVREVGKTGALGKEAAGAFERANNLSKMGYGMDEFALLSNKAQKSAAEGGKAFYKAEINGLINSLRASKNFARNVGQDTFNKIIGELATVAPTAIESMANNYWSGLLGRFAFGGLFMTAGGMGGDASRGQFGFSAVGALAGILVAFGFGAASKVTQRAFFGMDGPAFTKLLATSGSGLLGKNPSVTAGLAQLINQGFQADTVQEDIKRGLHKKGSPPKGKEALESVFKIEKKER